MEQEQEMNHRELGLLEEDDEEDEDGDTMNNASATYWTCTKCIG